MAKREKKIRILFIGNSLTYYNDLPLLVRRRAEEEGYACETVMIAHGGWTLAQHVREPEVRFNILYGDYDYVVLQEFAPPSGNGEAFLDAAKALNRMIREAGSIPVLFEPWTRKTEPEAQPHLNAVHREVREVIEAVLAPVGEEWQGYRDSRPDLELYAEDGLHPSAAGSDFAAINIWETIWKDMAGRKRE